jgi:hypothetical protein
MFMIPLPSQEVLKSLFDCDPDAGKLFHRRRSRDQFPNKHSWRTWNTRYAGKEAGCLRKDGYRVTAINGRIFLNHRLIHKWVTGEDIDGLYMDHKDIDPSNNAASNLCPVTSNQNASKQSEQKRVTSSIYKGCGWDKSRGKWMAFIKVNGKRSTLGRFDTELEAHRAYCLAALERFGEFANFGESSPFTRESLRA